MMIKNSKILPVIIIVLALFSAATFYAVAEEAKEGIAVDNPYAFATTPNAKTAAAFFMIHNHGAADVALINAKSDMAEIVEIHENLIDPDDGTMMMRKIKSLAVPAEGKALLEPKGYHIMFIKLNKQFVKGEAFPLTLEFDNGISQEITIDIVAPGLVPDKHDTHGHHGHSH